MLNIDEVKLTDILSAVPVYAGGVDFDEDDDDDVYEDPEVDFDEDDD